MTHKKNARSSERGNVLFYILIAVVLLAALSFAVSQSGRGNLSALDEDKARVYASEIIEYANIISAATSQLRLRGCTENQISVENDIVAGYTNAGAPSDKTCHIFHINGGGIGWRAPPTEWLDTAQSAATEYGNIFFPQGTCVYDVGTNSATLCNTGGNDEELLFIIPWLKAEVCKQINTLIGVTNPSNVPPKNGADAWESAYTKFTGAYGGDKEIGGVTYTELDGKPAGCFEGGGAGTVPPQSTYHFYKVLIAR